jgi:hypothetical protein
MRKHLCDQAALRAQEVFVVKRTKARAKAATKAAAGSVASVAGEALGAAAVTAAGVVLTRIAEGMGTGAKKIDASKPRNRRITKKAVAPQRKPSGTRKRKKSGQKIENERRRSFG